RVAPGREAGDVTELERLLHARREVAAIVRGPQRVLVWHRRGGEEILAAKLQPIQPELAGGVVDQPLEDVGGLRAAGAAVRRRRGPARRRSRCPARARRPGSPRAARTST